MSGHNPLAAVAGHLTRNGHTVTAVLHREDLAWEGLEKAMPTSISDLIMEVAMDEKGTDRDFEKTAQVLGLHGLLKVLDRRDHANVTQVGHGAIVLGLHNFVDVEYVGYDSKLCLKQLRFGTTSYVFMGLKSEEDLLHIATKPYQTWLKNRDTGWTNRNDRGHNWDDDERPEFGERE